MAMNHDYYAIIGVEPSATQAEIHRAFRAKALAAHPDRGGSAEKILLLNEAWNTLRNPDRRAAYDAQFRVTPAPPPRPRVKRVTVRKKVPRPPTFAHIAGSVVGKAFKALWGETEKPKAKVATVVVRSCRHCGQKLRIKKLGGSHAGRVVCPKCRHVQPR